MAITMLAMWLSSFSQFFFVSPPYRLPSTGSVGNVKGFLMILLFFTAQPPASFLPFAVYQAR
jgi:hypothetical protein